MENHVRCDLAFFFINRFGRKPALFTTIIIQVVATFAQIFSPNWEAFSIIFFFVGAGSVSNYVIAYVLGRLKISIPCNSCSISCTFGQFTELAYLVLGTEILSPGVRVVFSSLGVFLSSAIGYMLMSPVAYFIREWRWLLVPMAGSGLIYIPLWW
jgi:OCT family organic cation transporter-like MFS transporter 4/5